MESSTVSPTSSSDSGPSSSSSSGLAAVDSSESELEDFQEPGQEVLSAVKAGSTFFSSSKGVHVWCFEAILIVNNYTPGSSKGNICVLHFPKTNHKHSVSTVTTPPTVNKIIIAHRLQLFLKMRKVNTAAILAPLESLPSEEHESAWKLGTAPIIN